jgi:hypothetical protein
MQTTALARVRCPAVSSWLPRGKTAAVCFSVDDLHPSTAAEGCDAGGDLGAGSLGRLAGLLQRHPSLRVTLCVTPDWRLQSLTPRGLLRRLPWFRDHTHWTSLAAPSRFRLDRHPRFVRYLNGLERSEIVLHGLHHVHPGPRFALEFQDESEAQCRERVRRGLEIFEAAGIRYARGYVPPAWNAPPALIAALAGLKFDFLSSARDLETPVAAGALTAMSGLTGVSLLQPQWISGTALVHIACNFQATSSIDRALRILELGGVLHVKAHIFKAVDGHTMLDGLDELYCNYLDVIFSTLASRFGEQLWWAGLSEVAAAYRQSDTER